MYNEFAASVLIPKLFLIQFVRDGIPLVHEFFLFRFLCYDRNREEGNR